MCANDRCECELPPLPWEIAYGPEHDALDPVGAQLDCDPDAQAWLDREHDAAVAAQMVADAFEDAPAREVA